MLQKTISQLHQFTDEHIRSSRELGVILARAEKEALSLKDCAQLLNIKNHEFKQSVILVAAKSKENYFGSRIGIFSAIYVTNYCRNDCAYCGYRKSNKAIARKTLSDDELLQELSVLKAYGQQRICLVYGDNPDIKAADMVRHLQLSFDSGMTEAAINAHPLSKEDFRILVQSGLPVYYRVFQETYDKTTYKIVHLAGSKRSFPWRLAVHDRAILAGLKHLGLGILLGLYDFRFEVLALIAHVRWLYENYGVRVTSLSIPRLKPAPNTPFADSPPSAISEDDLLLIIAVLRLAVPYAEIIITDRETPQFKLESCRKGVSEMCAGNITIPGGYSQLKKNCALADLAIFKVKEHLTLAEELKNLLKYRLTPSFWSDCSLHTQFFQELKAVANDQAELHLAAAVFTMNKYLSLTQRSKEERQLIKDKIDEFESMITNPVLRNALEAGIGNLYNNKPIFHSIL